MLRIGTAKCGWAKWLSTNDSSTSFASRIPTGTRPTANIVEPQGSIASNLIQIVFFGAGSDDQTFDARLIGWNSTNTGSSTSLWVPTPLAGFSCTLSTAVGIASRDAVATDRFADTISGATYNPSGGVEIVSPTGDIIAHVVVDIKGSEIVQLDFDMTGATNGNAFYRWL